MSARPASRSAHPVPGPVGRNVRRSRWRPAAPHALLPAVTGHAPALLRGGILAMLLSAPLAADIPSGAPAPAIPGAAATPADQLQEIIVQTTEPRFVAPTRRDRIGR